MNAETATRILVLVAVLVLILSGVARGKGGICRAATLFGLGLLVAGGIYLAAKVAEQVF